MSEKITPAQQIALLRKLAEAFRLRGRVDLAERLERFLEGV